MSPLEFPYDAVSAVHSEVKNTAPVMPPVEHPSAQNVALEIIITSKVARIFIVKPVNPGLLYKHSQGTF